MTVPVRDAATVVLVRDGADGLEVCMLQRRLQSEFVAGGFVFPGGAVDQGDRDPGWEQRCVGLTDAEASQALGMPNGGLAYWVAAMRESFEECGLLPAVDAAGSPVRFDHPGPGPRILAQREAVDRGERSLADLCAEERVRLAASDLLYVGRWITPPGAPRRYDTRFFLGPAPEGQVAVHDDREVIASRWLRPSTALAEHDAGHFAMLPPTVVSLRSLVDFPSAGAVLAAASPDLLAASEKDDVARRDAAEAGTP